MPLMRFSFLYQTSNDDVSAQLADVEYLLNRIFTDARVFETVYIETMPEDYDPIPD